VASWLRFPIAGSKIPVNELPARLADFSTNWALHISVNKFFILSKEHNTQTTAHLLVQEKVLKADPSPA